MSDDTDYRLLSSKLVVTCVALLLALISSALWHAVDDSLWRRQCVERGAAAYDAKTGRWVWLEARTVP